MASRNCSAQVVEVPSSTAWRTLLQFVAPVDQSVAIRSYRVGAHGQVTTAKPGVIQFVRQTDAGTMDPLTPKVLNNSALTARTTVQQFKSGGAEPIAGDVLYSNGIHPSLGAADRFDDDEEIVLQPGERVGLRVLLEQSVPVTATVNFTE